MLRTTIISTLISLTVMACGPADRDVDYEAGDILVLGDSVIVWGREDGASVADVLALELGEPVVNAAASGARMSPPDPGDVAWWGGYIPGQYVSRSWRWVVLEGGVNDFLEACDCERCEDVVTSVADEHRALAQRAIFDGARVAFLGYYKPIEGENLFQRCANESEQLSRWLKSISAKLPGSIVVDASLLADPNDPADYDPDRIHPSAKLSAKIGVALAEAIKAAD